MSASRIGLLADVHANLPALRTALAALREEDVDQVVVAGDLVGYGASPNECISLLVDAGAVCVAGNHDLLFVGRLPFSNFPATARHAAVVTEPLLGADERRFLEGLPTVRRFGSVVVAHGSLDDPEEYVEDRRRAKELLSTLRAGHHGADTLVLGHTHLQWRVRGTNGPRGEPIRLVNPGSVGQSRDAETRARMRAAVLDTATGDVRFLRRHYPVEEALELQRRLGLSDLGVHHPPSWRSRVGRRLPAPARTAVRSVRRRSEGAA